MRKITIMLLALCLLLVGCTAPGGRAPQRYDLWARVDSSTSGNRSITVTDENGRTWSFRASGPIYEGEFLLMHMSDNGTDDVSDDVIEWYDIFTEWDDGGGPYAA